MAETSDEWELSKENIQPLQRGRRHEVLKVALAPQPDDIKVQQRQNFEKALRTYVGNDPLEIWYTYIKWVEQNFPKGGIEGQIELLIERCLKILKDEKKYHDDERFIEIWLKFANDSNIPLEIFPLMQSNNIGYKSANFYIAWAWELEQIGNLKKANQILTQGVQNKAEPISKMKSAYLEFESRIANKTKLGLELNDRVKEEQVRSAFSILKPQKKKLAPVSRVGHSVMEATRTNMTINRQQPLPKHSNTSKVPFKIYNAENIPVNNHAKSENPSAFILHSENFKENEKKVCKWNKVKVKQQLPRSSLSSTNDAEFKVHCDEDSQSCTTSKLILKPSNALNALKNSEDPPIALFERPDPMKKPMYDKNKIYGGAEEFSFEEIRAAKWFAEKAKRDQELKLAEQGRKLKEYMEKEQQMQAQIEYLTEKLNYLQSKFANEPNNDFSKISVIDLLQGKPSSSESYSEAANKIQELYNRTLTYFANETQGNLENLTENLKQVYSVSNTKCASHQSNSNAESISHFNEIPQANKQSASYIFYHDPTETINQPRTNLQPEVPPKDKEYLSNKLADKAMVPLMNKPTTPYIVYQDPTEKLNQLPTHLQPEILPKNKENLSNKLIDKATVSDMNKPTTPYIFYHDPREKLNQPNSNIQSDVPSRNKENVSTKLVDKATTLQINKTTTPYVVYHDPIEKSNQTNSNLQLDAPSKHKENLNNKSVNKAIIHHIFYDDSQGVKQKDVPLQVTSDDTEFTTRDKMKSNVDGASCQGFHDAFEDDIENIPPKEYIQNVEKRELAGILEPSKNIMYIPLELQKMEENSDADDEIEQEIVKPHFPDEQTLVLPCNTQHFAAAAFVSSTPCATSKRDPSLHYSKTENSISGIINSDPQCNEILEKKEVESTAFKSEKKVVDKDRSTFPMLPNSHLSVIMENSRECYSKSSSSSSSSVNSTKSIKLDKYYGYQSMNQKHLSKLETLKEPDSIIDLKCNLSDGKTDESILQPSELNHALENLKPEDLDPFDEELKNSFLKAIKIKYHSNVFHCGKKINSVKIGESIKVGDEVYTVQNLLASGAYAHVYEAESNSNSLVAIKVCKNSNDWELYICNELHRRLKSESSIDITNSITDLISAIKYTNGIVLLQEYCPSGTLLNVVNKHKPEQFPEHIAMYFTLELLHIVHRMHKCNIIHGDIKPDNILITNDTFSLEDFEHISERTVSLRLIDFGRSIDLKLFQELFNGNICFNTKLASESSCCTEMRDGKPWGFQLDWFGVLCCVHVILFSKYMTVKKTQEGRWTIDRKLKRYWHLALWKPLFDTLLNLPSCYEEPDIEPFTTLILSKLQQNAHSFVCQMQKLTIATK